MTKKKTKKTIKKKVHHKKKIVYKGRKPTGKSKLSKIKKLIKLALLRKKKR